MGYGPNRNGGRRSQRLSPYSSSKQVFVGNLTWATQWQDLKDMCKKYGNVKRADIAEENGRSKGYGIVIFSTAEEAQTCIADLHGKIVDGRDLTVKLDDKPNQYQYGLQPSNNFNFNVRGEMSFGGHVLQSPNNMGMVGGMGLMGGMNNYQKKGVYGTQVFVGNLPWSAQWQELKDLCKQFGTVKRADVMEENGRSKGYGIVQFADKASARACVAGLNEQEFDGRTLNVKIDTKMNKVVGNQRGGGMQFGQHRLTAPGGFGQGNQGGMQFGQHLLTAPGGFGRGNQGGMQFGQHRLTGSGGFGGNTKVFVGNLPWSFNKWQDLKDLCRNFGDVIRADIEEESDGRSKGYGIVTFANATGAHNCILNLNGHILNGRDLTVKLDKFKSSNKTKGKQKFKSASKKSMNWSDDEVPDQAALDKELDDYNKGRPE